MDGVKTYSKRAIWIHWFSTVLILITIPTGLAMSETVATEQKLLLYKIHFALGFLLFFLAILHIYVFFKDKRPEPVETGNTFRNKFIGILHKVLTILIIVLTITGVGSLFSTNILTALLENDYQLLLEDYNLTWVSIHHIQGIVYIVLIILHIGGVFLQRTKNKEVLKRMNLKI